MKNRLLHRLACAGIFVASLVALSGCGGSGSSNAYTIGGTIQGLTGSGLVLANGSDTLKVSANATTFTMPKAMGNGSPYDVTVQSHPTAVNCTIISGAGTVTGTDVTSISVSCQPGSEAVLYSFVGPTTDGSSPKGTLIQGKDGNFYGLTYAGGQNNDGTFFKITSGGVATPLYSFQGAPSDGSNPSGDLVQATDGNFYGMTAAGGASSGGLTIGPIGNGVVFKMTPTGTETILHVFQGGLADGANPHGSLIQGTDGNFYGMTQTGGQLGFGIVFKMTSTGTVTVLHSFQGGNGDGANPYGSLIQASDGNFYGMTQYGGGGTNPNNGVVFQITPTGIEKVLYSFQGGTADGANPYGSLIQGTDGNFYGMTNGGGANGAGVIFELTSGGTETVLYSFKAGTTDGGYPWGSLIQASDGNFYGLTVSGGQHGNGVIFEFTPGGSTDTILHSFQGALTDGASPYGSLVQGSDGTLYGMTNAGGTNLSKVGTVFGFN